MSSIFPFLFPHLPSAGVSYCLPFLLVWLWKSAEKNEKRTKLLIKNRSTFPGISWGNVTLAAALQSQLGGQSWKWTSGNWAGTWYVQEGAVKCTPFVEAPSLISALFLLQPFPARGTWDGMAHPVKCLWLLILAQVLFKWDLQGGTDEVAHSHVFSGNLLKK